MPYLTVTSNSLLDTASDQLKMLSKAVAESLEKEARPYYCKNPLKQSYGDDSRT